jgi:hypothetical protein
MRLLSNAYGIALATGRPLAAVRYLGHVCGDRAVLVACAVAVLIVNHWG